MKKFWNFFRNDEGDRVLRLEGPIDEDSFWGDEITPKVFREELEAEDGDVTVWINSPGGNVFCAAEIYTMLCDHKGAITVKIDAIAASAASVVAMAGDRVLMSPVSMLMIHDPMTIAMGNTKDMEKAITTLNEVKESIINAYARKSGLSRNKIAKLMSDETWMNAKKAVELGFADEILFAKADDKDDADETAESDDSEDLEMNEESEETEEPEKEKEDDKKIETRVKAFTEPVIKDWEPYSTRIMGQTILNRLVCSTENPATADEEPGESADDSKDVESVETGIDPVADENPGSICEEDTPGNAADNAADYGEVDTLPDASVTEMEVETEAMNEGLMEDAESMNDAERPPEKEIPNVPEIGMDGHTKDGAMPYELLMKQLEFLR